MSIRDIVAILIVLLTVWGGISKSIERAAKKRREQEMKKQRALLASGEGSLAQPQPAPLQVGRPVQPPRLADDLAARRRAQLDELRQRRTGRQITPAPPTFPQPSTLRPGPAPPREQVPRQKQSPVMRSAPIPAPARVQRPDHDIRQIEAGAAAWRRQQELEARRQREEQARRQVLERAAHEAENAEAARVQSPQTSPEPARRTAIRDIAATAPSEIAKDARSVVFAAAGLGVSSLRESLRSPAEVRRAIIMKELLDPPISLRA